MTGKRVPASRVDRSTSVHISGFFAVVVVVVIVTSIKQLKKKIGTDKMVVIKGWPLDRVDRFEGFDCISSRLASTLIPNAQSTVPLK